MKYFPTVIIIILIIGAIYYKTTQPQHPSQASLGASTQKTPVSTLGVETKTSGCIASNALQDASCTPGSVFPNVTKNEICQPGYAKSVRNVTTEEKRQVYAEYGITHHTTGEYEVDHLISLELGGSNDIANLWPEAANPTPGFHQKDQVENYLHDQVCNDSLTLQQAQQEIAKDWLSVYRTLPQGY